MNSRRVVKKSDAARTFIFGLLIFSFLPVKGIDAETWNVPASISTIQAAIDTATSSDTVAVAPGIYHERLSMIGKNLVLLGTGGSENTFLSGATFFSDCQSILYLEDVDSTCLISGFTFENGGDSCVFGGAIFVTTNDSLLACPRIENNTFRDNMAYNGGAISEWLYGRASIIGNRFENNIAFQHGGAIDIRIGSGGVIRNNLFLENKTVKIFSNQIINQGGAISLGISADTTYVRSNVLFGNEAGYGGGIAIANFAEGVLENNTIVLNRSSRIEPFRAAGIRVYDAYCKLQNNIIAFNANGWGIQASGGPVLEFACNDFFGNELGNYADVAPGLTDISADPLICNWLIEDFFLASNSPCLPAHSGNCGLIGARGEGCNQTIGVDEGPTDSHKPSLIRVHDFLPGAVVFFVQSEAGKEEQEGQLEIFDVQGRLVHRLPIVIGPTGKTYKWEGTDRRGTQASRGVYFARAGTKSSATAISFVFLE